MDVNLVLLKKDGSHKIFPLPSSITIIGRRRDCDLCIPLMAVSRRHCQLNKDGGVLRVRDLGSRNGTGLNGKPIDETVIRAGDSLKVGPLVFMLQIDGQPKDIDNPDSPAQNLPRQDVTTQDTTEQEFDSLIEMDESDSSLDIFDSSEEANST